MKINVINVDIFILLLTFDDQVYPHVATGFSDTSAFLRELTLKSMLILAPKVCLLVFILAKFLSFRNVIGVIRILGTKNLFRRGVGCVRAWELASRRSSYCY